MKFTFLKQKKFFIPALLVVAGVVIGIAVSGSNAPKIQTDTAKYLDLKQSVLATGTVTSSTDVALSFKSSGFVKDVLVKVGDKVKPGQVLAKLDQKDQLASLTQARGALALAQANLRKILDGASNEDIKIQESAVASARVALNNAKINLDIVTSQQNQQVVNAKKALLNSTLTASPVSSLSTTTVTISGAYTSTAEGSYKLTVYLADGVYYSVNGLSTSSGPIVVGVPLKFGTDGLYVTFATLPQSYESWTVEIPNTQAVTYVTNLNAYNSALQTQQSALATARAEVETRQSALDQAIATLDAKRAQARPAEVAGVQAQVLSAQGQVQSALAQLDSSQITTPVGGTVTKVDVKVGELASAAKPVITVQDVGNLYVEASISEANIATLKIDQPVSFTLDALGPDRKFTGLVKVIEPASTVVSGVVNYKITASLEPNSEIKPGMTANMSILTAEKTHVLAVPQRAVLEKGDGKVVRVVTDSKKGTFEEKTVTTGLNADGGLVEITSGLQEGQTVVTFVEKK